MEDDAIKYNELCSMLNQAARKPSTAAALLLSVGPKLEAMADAGKIDYESAVAVTGFLRHAIAFHHKREKGRYKAQPLLKKLSKDGS